MGLDIPDNCLDSPDYIKHVDCGKPIGNSSDSTIQEIDKLKKETNYLKIGFRAATVLSGLAAFAGIFLLVATSLTPIGWAAIGLSVILLGIAAYCIKKRYEKEKQMELKITECRERLHPVDIDVNAEESRRKELHIGKWLFLPFVGWAKAYQMEKQNREEQLIIDGISSDPSGEGSPRSPHFDSPDRGSPNLDFYSPPPNNSALGEL